MSDRYEYSELETGFIRLLHIKSVTPEIHLEVEVVSLNSHPTYNSLSYQWGVDKPFKRIFIGDRYIDIAKNLSICLSHMSDYIGEKIWIDALCINQQDDIEKSRQVLRMTSIYKQACKVLVWLGPSADGSDEALDGITRYGGAAVKAGLLDLEREYLSRWPDIGDDPGRLKTKEKVSMLICKATEADGDAGRVGERFPRVAFAALSHREYFNRVWVKQEVTLARNAVVMCGRKSTDPESFHAAILFHGLLVMWEGVEWSAGRLTRFPGPFSMEELMAASTPWDLLKTVSVNPAIGSLFAARRKHQISQEMRPLHELLHTSYVRSGAIGLQCKDPRDKIFGLLGIVGDAAELGIVSDYSKTAEEVYEGVARAMITKQGHIDILKWCRSRRCDPPTWVPDFNADIAYPWTDEMGTPLFKAATSRAQTQETPDTYPADPKSIRLRGVYLEAVTAVGSAYIYDAEETFNQMAVRKMFQELRDFLESKSIYAKKDWIDANWRIPICDRERQPESGYFQRATDSSKEEFIALSTKLMDENVMAQTLSYQASMEYVDGARPILSGNGYVGLGPKETQPGDIICLLFGASVPFVLRPSDNGAYFLVGEAYVYGVMDGEAMEKELREVTFELK
ncbi:Fc.00g011320.m01.CDS01 [Cosmosporella sp. VM-42]